MNDDDDFLSAVRLQPPPAQLPLLKRRVAINEGWKPSVWRFNMTQPSKAALAATEEFK